MPEETPVAPVDQAPADAAAALPAYKPGDIIEVQYEHLGVKHTGVAVVVGTLLAVDAAGEAQPRVRFVQIATYPHVSELPATDVTRAE